MSHRYEMYSVENIVVVYQSLGFPDSSVVKESTCNAGDPSFIPGLEKDEGINKNVYFIDFIYYSISGCLSVLPSAPPTSSHPSSSLLFWLEGA